MEACVCVRDVCVCVCVCMFLNKKKDYCRPVGSSTGLGGTDVEFK